MIRINLLQGPKSRKVRGQWDVHAEATAAAVLVVLALGGCMYYAGVLDDEVQAKIVLQKQKRAQINALKEKLKKVENFEKKKKQLEDKNKVIEQLEKRRGGPVRIMDEISRGLDPLKLWLVHLSVENRRVEVRGRALENDDVVGFVNNLRRSDVFDKINLGEIRATGVKTQKVFEFKLTMRAKPKA